MRFGILAVVQNHRNRPHPTHIVYHQATTKHQITTHHLLLRISLPDALPYQLLDLQVAYFTVYSSLTILTLEAYSLLVVTFAQLVSEQMNFFVTLLQQIVTHTIVCQCCTMRTHCHTPLPQHVLNTIAQHCTNAIACLQHYHATLLQHALTIVMHLCHSALALPSLCTHHHPPCSNTTHTHHRTQQHARLHCSRFHSTNQSWSTLLCTR